MADVKPWRDEERLRELYIEQRYSTREIGEILDCSRKTIENWLSRLDIEREKPPWQDKERLAKLRDQQLSEAQIAKRFCCSQATVHKWLVRFDLDTSRTKQRQPWHSEEMLRELYVEQKLTMDDVATELDCSRQAIEEWIHRHGIETRSRNPDPPRELQHGEAMRVLYQDKGLSTYQIAEYANCAPSAVHNWLKEHDIETRSVGSQPGELHHRWKGGVDPYYGPNWSEQRRQTLERDNYECQECGVSQEEYREEHHIGLDVHHKRPVREFEDTSRANRLENLVTLCRQCHNRLEGTEAIHD